MQITPSGKDTTPPSDARPRKVSPTSLFVVCLKLQRHEKVIIELTLYSSSTLGLALEVPLCNEYVSFADASFFPIDL